jgi:hypothetical protein
MKNIKWHKFFIVALFVWVANSIASIKVNREFKPYAIAILLFFIVIVFESCGSSCSRTKRYWRKHRVVEMQIKKDVIPTFKASGKIAMR